MTGADAAVGSAGPDPTPRRAGWRDVALLWLLSRVFLEGLALVAVAVGGPARDREPGFFGLLHHWDSNWFDAIMRAGYFGSSSVDSADYGARAAFFPGYPLVARAAAWITGGGDITTGSGRFALWVVPFVASFVAAAFLYHAVLPRFGRAIALWSTGLLLFGPYAVFLAASYSEALFLAFAIGAWWAMARRNPLLAGVLAAGASWVRINGAFLAVALVVLYVQQQRAAGERIRPAALAGLSLSFAGVAGYLGWLWATTGSATFWLHAQSERFGRQGTWPWTALINAIKLPIVDHRFDYRTQRVAELLAAVVLVASVVVFLRVREWAATTYVVLSLVSLVTNVSYLSLARNSLVVFPVFVLGGVLVVRSRRRWAVYAGLGVAVVFTVLNTVLFSLGYWAD